MWLHLVDKMSAHMAAIIGVLDRHCGLDHLLPDPQHVWRRRLFVRMLNQLDLETTASTSANFK